MNDLLKVREFKDYLMTGNGGYGEDTFEGWQRNNPRVKVVSITPFHKITSSVNQPTPPSGSQGTTLVIVPAVQTYYELHFLVSYIERDLEKQASQLETFLEKDE